MTAWSIRTASGRVQAWLDATAPAVSDPFIETTVVRPGLNAADAPLLRADLVDLLGQIDAYHEAAGRESDRADHRRDERDAATARAEKAEAKAAGLQAVIDATDPVRLLAFRLRARLDEERDAQAGALGVEACEQRTRAEKAEAERDQARAQLAANGHVQFRICQSPDGPLVDWKGVVVGEYTGFQPWRGSAGRIRLEFRTVAACRSCGTTTSVWGDPPLCSNCFNYGTPFATGGVISADAPPFVPSGCSYTLPSRAQVEQQAGDDRVGRFQLRRRTPEESRAWLTETRDQHIADGIPADVIDALIEATHDREDQQ